MSTKMMVYVSLYSREGVYPKRTKTAIDADCPKRARRRPPRPRTRYCQFFNGCIGEAVYGLVWDKVSRLQVRVFTAPSKCSVLNPKLLDWTANQVPRFCKEHRHDHHLDLKHPAKFKYNGEIQVDTAIRFCLFFFAKTNRNFYFFFSSFAAHAVFWAGTEFCACWATREPKHYQSQTLQ